MCYLAHPVDFQEGLEPDNADFVRQSLQAAGFVVYSPARAFAVPPGAGVGPAIHRINQAALAECDALVAMYPEANTIGVPMELQKAIDLGIPALVISRASNRSWALAGLPDTVRVVRYPGKGVNFEWLASMVGARTHRPLRTLVWPDAILPTRAYSGDAGFDLYCEIDYTVAPNAVVDIPCGVAVQLPDGVWGLIVGRSSTLRKHNLLVNLGVIDTGWRGKLFANVKNLGVAPFEVKRGMRLAQLIPLPNLAAELTPTEVQNLAISDRGESGFGSSGE